MLQLLLAGAIFNMAVNISLTIGLSEVAFGHGQL